MIANPEQEEAIQCEKQHILVLAGAGSGKTKTLIDKIKYYINQKRINPKHILAITFTKDAAEEIKDRLIEHTDKSNQFKTDLQKGNKFEVRKKYIEKNSVLQSLTVCTFHSLCYTILRENGAGFYDNKFRILPEKYDTSGIDQESINDKETITSLLKKSIVGACQQSKGFELSLERYLIENHLQKKRDYVGKPSAHPKAYICLNGSAVRSKSEQKICDWFYLRGYEIQYEPLEKTSLFHFSPDFKLNAKDFYIEHKSNISAALNDKLFALRNSGKPVFVTHEEWMHDSRKIESELMKILHQAYGGNFTIDYSKAFDNKFRSLQDELGKFIKEIKQAYDIAKSQNLSCDDIQSIKSPLLQHQRIRSFYKLFPEVWKSYEEIKRKHSVIDFNDLITLTIDLLKKKTNIREFYQERFKCVLVDEFQDVNPAQVQLLKLFNTPTTNLFCVGDDWQSIYGFRGSDVNYIINFNDHFTGSQTIKLKYNFRSSENIVRVGEEVIKHNKNKIEKEVLTLKKSEQKVTLFKSHSNLDVLGYLQQEISRHLENGTKHSEILILGKRRDHFKNLQPPLKNSRVRFSTIHGSKGLEAKVVFILGLTHGSGGFPDTWMEDSIYQVLKPTDKSILLEEERRLFYVAITRAKDHLYLITANGLESQFIDELPEAFIDEVITQF